MRKMLAIGATKFLIWLGQAMNKQGSSTPGKIGLKIYPNLLKDLAAQVREDIFVVCGTNGKTTTNNLLCEALRSEGKKVVCNSAGANMLYGIVTAFADSASISGNVIAPRRNVQLEHRRGLAFDLAQLGSNALRQIDTACFHTGEQQVLRALVFLYDFERDAGQCTANAILIEYDLRFGQSAASLQKCKKMTLRHNN